MVKDLDRRSLSWIIQVGPNCNHLHPCKTDTQRRRHIENRRRPCDHGSRDGSDAATSQRMLGATGSWKRQMEGFSPRAFGGNMALPPWFWTSASRTVRDSISVVSSHLVYGNLLQKPQETNAPVVIITSLLVLPVIQGSAEMPPPQICLPWSPSLQSAPLDSLVILQVFTRYY